MGCDNTLPAFVSVYWVGTIGDMCKQSQGTEAASDLHRFKFRDNQIRDRRTQVAKAGTLNVNRGRFRLFGANLGHLGPINYQRLGYPERCHNHRLILNVSGFVILFIIFLRSSSIFQIIEVAYLRSAS